MNIKFILLTAIIVLFTAFANAQSSIVGDWKIVSITNEKGKKIALGKGENRLTFENDKFYGSVCNSFGSDYSRDKNELKISRMRSTLMLCLNMKPEDAVMTVLSKTAYFSIQNNVLTLQDQNKKVSLQLKRIIKTKANLIGSWKLNSLQLDGKNLSSTNEKEVLLNIEKAKIGGNGGCNAYGGNAAITGNTVKFSNIFSTKMFCEGSIENQYFAALEEVVNFELKNNQLILTDKKKQTVLIFDKVNK